MWEILEKLAGTEVKDGMKSSIDTVVNTGLKVTETPFETAKETREWRGNVIEQATGKLTTETRGVLLQAAIMLGVAIIIGLAVAGYCIGTLVGVYMKQAVTEFLHNMPAHQAVNMLNCKQ